MPFYIEALDEKGYGLAYPYSDEHDRDEHAQGAQVHRLQEGAAHRPKPVRIPFTLPGEVVNALATRRREKGRAVYRLTDVLRPHSERVAAPCPHFGSCGGCMLQHMAYAEEMRYKRKRVQQATMRAGFSEDLVEDVLGMNDPWMYRNKMEFTFAPDGALGLNRLGDFRTVEPLSTCLIAQAEIVSVMKTVAQWAKAFKLSGYDKEQHTGFLRHIMVRKSARGALLLALFATEAPLLQTGVLRPDVQALLQQLAAHEGLTTVVWYVFRGRADRVGFDQRYILKGEAYIEDELLGLTYRLQPETFFQTNALQAERLLQVALEYADVRASMQVIDLFSGVGTFTLPLAQQGEMAYGIEIVPRSVEKPSVMRKEITSTMCVFLPAMCAARWTLCLRQAGAALIGSCLTLRVLGRAVK